MAGSASSGSEATYSTGARHFHWWTVALIAIQVPLGVYMVYRGNTTNFDALTNTLYSWHKTLGMVILLLVIARLYLSLLARRSSRRADPGVVAEGRFARHALDALPALDPGAGHGLARYLLYGAREVFGLFSIPPLAAPDQSAADRVLTFTGTWASSRSR